MIRRTTIEIDEKLLVRAKEALGEKTIRGTVEEALRRVADELTADRERRAESQTRYLEQLSTRVDPELLGSDEMWR